MWRRGKEEADAPSPRRRRNYGSISVPTSCKIVRAMVYRNFASYSDADLMHIIEQSTDRIKQVCPPVTVCGGCQYQHIMIKRQRNMKTVQVQELFKRFGGLLPTDFFLVLDTNVTNTHCVVLECCFVFQCGEQRSGVWSSNCLCLFCPAARRI
jgi:hypothetical protein